MNTNNNTHHPATPQFLNDILKQLSSSKSSSNNFSSSSIISGETTNNNLHLLCRQPNPSPNKNNNRQSTTNNNLNNNHKNNHGHKKRRNVPQKTIKTIQSRSWFASEDDWLLGNAVPVQSPSFVFKELLANKQDFEAHNKQSVVSAFDFFQIQKKENVNHQLDSCSMKTIIANTDQSVCPICEEDLNKSYDSQRMNWILSEAEFSPSLNLYVHSNCANSKKRKGQSHPNQIFESLKKVKI